LLGAVDGRPPATVADVLEALPTSRWAHFACHALSDLTQPSSSRLLLGDGRDHPLSIMDVLELDLGGVELAFLSACATARPAPNLIDEVVHLASAFRMAGYRHVVATLWPVGDRSAALISEQFYRGLAERGNSAAAAPIALHAAVRQLRDRIPDRPSKWAAHVHVGP
jgi:CHAT domain-containing protein